LLKKKLLGADQAPDFFCRPLNFFEMADIPKASGLKAN